MKILFLQKRLLFPHNTGGKIRSLNVLRHLAKWHEVTYVSNLLEEENPFLKDMENLGVQLKNVAWDEAPRRSLRFAMSAVRNLFSPTPLNVDKDFDPKLRALVEQEISGDNYDLLICDFVQMARNCIGLQLPKLLFQHNVEAEIFERLAGRSRFPMKQYLRVQAKRMYQFEGQAGKDFDAVVAVSHRDKEMYEERYGWEHVTAIDTAVDTNYFQPPMNDEGRKGIVFVGSMDWPPNVDGMLRFLSAIWPTIRSQNTDAKLTVVGRNPPEAILQHDGTEGVQITGTVDDIRPFLENAAIAIVPLYSGGGTRLKIFEYMAMRLPVVSTTLGAEGLDVRDGEHVVIQDDDDSFASAVLKLLDNEEHRQSIGQSALELVQTRFSSEPVARQFESICETAVKRWNTN